MTVVSRAKLGRALRRSIGLAIGALAVLAAGPVSLLAVIAETRHGRLVGLIAGAVFVASLCVVALLWRIPTSTRPWWLAAGASILIAVGLTLDLVLVDPPKQAGPRSSGLVAVFSGQWPVPPLSPFGLVPEIDQVKLVVTLATRPLFWSSRARTIRETTLAHYRRIEADPDARGLGPVTHFAALELLQGGFETRHFFAYVPEPKEGETLGAIVFLHGNGGNFQVLPWAWRTFAEEHRLAILCPTFGFGFWGEGGVEAVDRAWEDARRLWPIDPNRVYLGGISDGGVGVTRSALAHPERYRGLIYVSPTMNREELARSRFVDGWKGRPILVLQGDRDVNVPRSTVDPAVELLRGKGVAVDYRVFEGEDHFLFFSRSSELFGVIDEWMVKVSANDPDLAEGR